MKNIINTDTEHLPYIALVINNYKSIEELKAYKSKSVDILELRIDLMGYKEKETINYMKNIKEKTDYKIITTIRETNENKNKRKDLFHNILPYTDIVDIEIDTPIKKDIIELYKNKTKILSYHNFEKTPPINKLDDLYEKAKNDKADILKLAVTANSFNDTSTFLCFCKNISIPCIAISMGKFGMISRICAPVFNSPIVYTFDDKDPVAPGQIGLDELYEYIKRFYTNRKRHQG